jgi:hypothetical protein
MSQNDGYPSSVATGEGDLRLEEPDFGGRPSFVARCS